MRERKRRDRENVKPVSILSAKHDVKPKLDELRQLVRGIEQRYDAKPKQAESLPIYNPAIHKAGDRVLIQQGKRLIPTIVPEIDADGHPY